MRASFISKLACGIVVILAVASVYVFRHEWGSSASMSNEMSAPGVEYEEENIPIYPGALEVETGKIWENDWRRIGYTSHATVEEVGMFYIEQLQKRGWVLNYENRKIPGQLMLSYAWHDSEKLKPWDLEVTITITERSETPHGSSDTIPLPVPIDSPWPSPTPNRVEEDTKETNSPGTYVDIGLSREPNFDRVPLYPGAEQIEMQGWCDDMGDTSLATSVRCIIYSTKATRMQVEEYYKYNLAQHGWQFNKGRDSEQGSISFRWSKGSRGGGKLTIITEELSAGITKVTMKLVGRK